MQHVLTPCACASPTFQPHLSYVAAGAAASKWKAHKRNHYAFLGNNYFFCPFAVETLGTFGEEALALVKDPGSRIREITGKAKSRLYLTQRISIEIQRGNAISILASLPHNSNILHEVLYL